MAQKTLKITTRLSGVRLSFPSLFEKSAFDDKDEAKYSAHFIIRKDDSVNMNILKSAIKKMLDANNEGKRLSPDRYCMRDGDTKPELDGYGEDVVFVSASSKLKPKIWDSDNSQLDMDDGKPYAGCYVDVSFDMWWQDHKKYGKRVNAQLRAVRFNKDGEPFGGGPSDAEDEFGAVVAATGEEASDLI